MQALSLEDILPLDQYAERRREFFEAHGHYLDRYRRVRVGPRLTLLFENRQTLWFRLQEVLCIARLQEPALVQQELDLYNRLLPSRECLQAAMVIAVEDESQFRQELAPWQQLQGNQLSLHVGPQRYPANLFTCRPEDRCIGTTHWVQFILDAPGRRLLADGAQPAHVAVTLPEYQHQSPPLSPETRQSLVEDLSLSDRDAA
jgi:Protein of unknown function (DUF3501)